MTRTRQAIIKKESVFFSGASISSQLTKSVYGKLTKLMKNFLSIEEIAEYALPRVIVIGNESTGKSSLLENITKCQVFPRSGVTCTKCPIILRLRKAAERQYRCNGQNISSSKKLAEHLDQLMNSMTLIQDTEVIVEISGPDLPDFEFCDLPGLIAYPEAERIQTETLCKKYLADPNAIVLCVVPATTPRLSSCQSIALIKSCVGQKPPSARTILALTMVDRLQEENIDELLIDRLSPTGDVDFPCIAVINRFHSDKHSLIDNEKLETKWFADSLRGCPVEVTSRCGSNQLLVQMDKFYNDFIESQWIPNVVSKLDVKLVAARKVASELGEVVCAENLDKFTIELHRRISEVFLEMVFLRYISSEGIKRTDILNFEKTWADAGQSGLYHRNIAYVNKLDECVMVKQINLDDAFEGDFARFVACNKSTTAFINAIYDTQLLQIPVIKQRLTDALNFYHTMTGNLLRGELSNHNLIYTRFEYLFKSLVLHPMNIKPVMELGDFVESKEHQAKRVSADATINSLIQRKLQISVITC
jgi:hypothetical protein